MALHELSVSFPGSPSKGKRGLNNSSTVSITVFACSTFLFRGRCRCKLATPECLCVNCLSRAWDSPYLSCTFAKVTSRSLHHWRSEASPNLHVIATRCCEARKGLRTAGRRRASRIRAFQGALRDTHFPSLLAAYKDFKPNGSKKYQMAHIRKVSFCLESCSATGEIAHSIKYLLCKCKDLRLISTAHTQKLVEWHTLISSALGRAEGLLGLIGRPAYPIWRVLGQGKILSQKTRWAAPEEWLLKLSLGPYMHVHTPVKTCTHTHFLNTKWLFYFAHVILSATWGWFLNSWR